MTETDALDFAVEGKVADGYARLVWGRRSGGAADVTALKMTTEEH
jgi:hypothetical protein